jgi:transposase
MERFRPPWADFVAEVGCREPRSVVHRAHDKAAAGLTMMGRLNQDQGQLFYSFCLDEVVPSDHRVREIAAVLDLSWVHAELAPHYSHLGRPSIDPVLMIRLLIVGYVFAIRSERLLCREVQVNLAYRWFCGLSIEDKIPDHSAFSRARNERFHDSDIFRRVFERVVEACIVAGLVGGEGFAVDASLIVADANKQRSISGRDWDKKRDPATASRAVKDYLATLDDAAFGMASDVTPKFVSPSDPAAQWTGAMRGPAFFAYADNYLIDVKVGIIMDVEATRAIRQAEVGAARTMIERTEERFGVRPERLAADTAYGSAANLDWLVNEKQIAPHIPVIDKSKREDARGLHLRQGERRLHLPCGRASEDDRHGQHRPCDALHGTRAGMPGVSAQAKMLPEHARPQDRARRQRGRPRRGSSACHNRGLRTIMP